MLLNTENSGEQDQECPQEWLVNTDPISLSTTEISEITRLKTRSSGSGYLKEQS